MKKRIISFMLIAVLMAGIWDVSVFAQEGTAWEYDVETIENNSPGDDETQVDVPEKVDEETEAEEITVTDKDAADEDVIAEDATDEVVDEADVLEEQKDTVEIVNEAEGEKITTKDVPSFQEFNTANMYAIMNYGIQKEHNRAMLLKVPDNKNGAVNPMIISPADHSTGELYTFRKVYSWYTLAPLCADSYRMNIKGNEAKMDTDVGLAANTNHSSQGWYFEPVSGVTDGYVIRSANNPDMVLDTRGTTTGKGVKVKIYNPENPCQIWIVKSYAPSIKMNKTSVTMDIGKKVTLSVTKKPVDGAVSYSTSSSSVATVNSKGVVTAKKAGTATITATCYGKTATCKITVRKSTLSVGSKLQKGRITKGSTNGVSGTVKSNKKITKIYAQIIGKNNKKTYYKKTVKPNKTSYKLTGAVDNAMRFDKLGAGAYIFRVTAWDTAGNKVSKDIGCTVEVKPAALKNGKSGKINISLYTQNDKRWTSVRIGNSSSTIGRSSACPEGGYGCTLTSIAMIEKYFQKNSSITPKTVAQSKNDFNGDLVNWKGTYSKHYKADSSTSLEKIYAQIKSGKPVIVGVSKNNSNYAFHWVVVYGYENVKLNKSKKPVNLKMSNFLIRDPGWGNGRKKLSYYKKVVKAAYRK